MSTVQFSGIPDGNAPHGCDAGVVALKTRSVPAADAVTQSLAALAWLKAQGCSTILDQAERNERDGGMKDRRRTRWRRHKREGRPKPPLSRTRCYVIAAMLTP